MQFELETLKKPFIRLQICLATFSPQIWDGQNIVGNLLNNAVKINFTRDVNSRTPDFQCLAI